MAEVVRTEQHHLFMSKLCHRADGRLAVMGRCLRQATSWSDLWNIPQPRLSFLIRVTYDILPCPRNLHQWFSNEEIWSLCNNSNVSLKQHWRVAPVTNLAYIWPDLRNVLNVNCQPLQINSTPSYYGGATTKFFFQISNFLPVIMSISIMGQKSLNILSEIKI